MPAKTAKIQTALDAYLKRVPNSRSAGHDARSWEGQIGETPISVTFFGSNIILVHFRLGGIREAVKHNATEKDIEDVAGVLGSALRVIEHFAHHNNTEELALGQFLAVLKRYGWLTR